MIKTSICFCKNNSNIVIFDDYNLPKFNEVNGRKIEEKLKLYFCNKCNGLFNPHDNDKVFDTIKYTREKVTCKLQIRKKNKIYSMLKLQTLFTLKNIKKKKELNILDYGCFDGSLLIELEKNLTKSNFFGIDYDIMKKIFPSKKNFFFKKSIHDIQEKLDIVIFSESIFYIKNANEILNQVHKKLKPNGVIIVQTIDMEKNLFYFLNTDYYFFPTKNTMRYLFNKNNFEIIIDDNSFIPKYNIYLLRKNNVNKNLDNKNYYNVYKKKFKTLNQTYKRINRLKSVKYIFGTKLNANFAYDALKNKNIQFLDEDKNKLKLKNNGKKIIHPSMANKKHFILINYSKNNSYYKNLLNKKYNLSKFICVR